MDRGRLLWRLFAFCVELILAMSRLDEAPSEARLEGLTFATTTREQARSSRRTWTMLDVALSLVLVGMVAFVAVYFRG